MSAENKAIIRRMIEEVWNNKNLAAVDEVVAADCIGHPPTGIEARGSEGVKQNVTRFCTAFPDLHWTIEDMIAEGDKVVIRNTFRGTHQGEFLGIAPTGKQVMVTATGTYRLKDGKIAEGWVNQDLLGLLQQLGATLK
ncbi:MAG: ester cyclase [Thaumarchaeota archaeon]|nr:ester cyclase [Nitrososphaerota archaeon]